MQGVPSNVQSRLNVGSPVEPMPAGAAPGAEGVSITPDELVEHCQEHLSSYKCPEEIRIVTSLPRDPNGKVRKAELREQARAAT